MFRRSEMSPQVMHFQDDGTPKFWKVLDFSEFCQLLVFFPPHKGAVKQTPSFK